jgi:2-desacetyl-2-hydroxyethyl bacteriochlorophyllide A dehydrogenase
MNALWLENQHLSMREVPQPKVSAEALIRIRLSGICGTDLELVRGYYPFTGIPGHEFVGEVVAIDHAAGPIDPEGEAAWIGRRVVGEINVTCGRCDACRNGRPSHCEARSVLGIAGRNGVHAEFTTLPLTNLHPVPERVPDEAAVFTEPLAAALEIQQQVHLHPQERVLLIGAGRLGQLVAQTLALTGVDLAVVARHPRQQQLLAERGIRLLAEEAVQSRRWDVVVEATGSPSGFELARRALRPRGTLILKSTYRGEMRVNWSPFVVDEITIIGSRCGPFAPALRLLEQGAVDPTVLIAEQYPLRKALQAMEAARQPGCLKVLLEA